MKKLEDIPKKNIYNVPEGYFEKLPWSIQSRIAEKNSGKETTWVFGNTLRYAIPVLVLLIITVFGIRHIIRPVPSAETMLASIGTDDLITYLDETDLTTEELLDLTYFDAQDAEQIEENVYGLNLQEEELENIINDIDLNGL